jgi:hypothetical protein
MGVGSWGDSWFSPAEVEAKRDLEPVKGPFLDLLQLDRIKPLFGCPQVPDQLLTDELGLVGLTGTPVVTDGMNKGSHVSVNV